MFEEFLAQNNATISLGRGNGHLTNTLDPRIQLEAQKGESRSWWDTFAPIHNKSQSGKEGENALVRTATFLFGGRTYPKIVDVPQYNTNAHSFESSYNRLSYAIEHRWGCAQSE
jgi:hypothetical protein